MCNLLHYSVRALAPANSLLWEYGEALGAGCSGSRNSSKADFEIPSRMEGIALDAPIS